MTAPRTPGFLELTEFFVAPDARVAGIGRALLGAHTAIDWLLGECRFRIDPFYCHFLADGPWARLDRYLPLNPCLML